MREELISKKLLLDCANSHTAASLSAGAPAARTAARITAREQLLLPQGEVEAAGEQHPDGSEA